MADIFEDFRKQCGLAWSERAGDRSGVYLASGAEGHEYIVYLYSVYRIAT